MASLQLPMRRGLAVVDGDGDSATGDDNNVICDSRMNVNDDGNSVTDEDIDDNNCD